MTSARETYYTEAGGLGHGLGTVRAAQIETSHSAMEGQTVGMMGTLTAKSAGWLNSEHVFPRSCPWFRAPEAQDTCLHFGTPRGSFWLNCGLGAGTWNSNHREIAHRGEMIF